MARPRKTGLDYFPHDVDVTTDPKIEPAILLYGAAAYAFYFVHLEYCYRSNDFCIDVSDSVSGAEMREVIRRKLMIDADDYDRILHTFLRHGAFDAEVFASSGRLTSDGIKKRAENVIKKRVTDEPEKPRKTDVSGVSDAETGDFRQVSASETVSETPQSKAKKTKEKNKGQGQGLLPGAENPAPGRREETDDIKPDKSAKKRSKGKKPEKTEYAEFVRMTDGEYSSLVAKVGNEGASRCIEILDNYKGANGKRYDSDYRAILNWVIGRYGEERAKASARASPAQRDDPFWNYAMEAKEAYDAIRHDDG